MHYNRDLRYFLYRYSELRGYSSIRVYAIDFAMDPFNIGRRGWNNNNNNNNNNNI